MEIIRVEPYKIKLLRKVWQLFTTSTSYTLTFLFVFFFPFISKFYSQIGNRWVRISCIPPLGETRRSTESGGIVRESSQIGGEVGLSGYWRKQFSFLTLNTSNVICIIHSPFRSLPTIWSATKALNLFTFTVHDKCKHTTMIN